MWGLDKNPQKWDKVRHLNGDGKQYGVPFPPKFNVPFYIVLCIIYPTFCVCHLSLHSRFNFRPLYYPWGKMGTSRSPFPTPQYVLHLFRHRLHMDKKQSMYRLKSLKERHFLCPVNVWGGNAKKNYVIYTKVNINFVYCTINATIRWRNGSIMMRKYSS